MKAPCLLLPPLTLWDEIFKWHQFKNTAGYITQSILSGLYLTASFCNRLFSEVPSSSCWGFGPAILHQLGGPGTFVQLPFARRVALTRLHSSSAARCDIWLVLLLPAVDCWFIHLPAGIFTFDHAMYCDSSAESSIHISCYHCISFRGLHDLDSLFCFRHPSSAVLPASTLAMSMALLKAFLNLAGSLWFFAKLKLLTSNKQLKLMDAFGCL